MPTNSNGSTRNLQTKRVITALVVVLIVAGSGFWLWHSSRTAAKSTATTKSTSPSTTTVTASKQYSATSTNQATADAAGSTASTTTTSLTAPSGQLLNIQTVSLASGPGLESVCQTIANASCNIRLTQGSTTKYVGAQNTGGNGMVIFDWNAKTVGLTTGQWSVNAIVTQNDATGVSHTEYLTVQP